MFNIDNIPKDVQPLIKGHFLNNEYEKITLLFLQYRVTTCPECASNHMAIREWCNYWIQLGLI